VADGLDPRLAEGPPHLPLAGARERAHIGTEMNRFSAQRAGQSRELSLWRAVTDDQPAASVA
jgi:hypothetical protein